MFSSHQYNSSSEDDSLPVSRGRPLPPLRLTPIQPRRTRASTDVPLTSGIIRVPSWESRPLGPIALKSPSPAPSRPSLFRPLPSPPLASQVVRPSPPQEPKSSQHRRPLPRLRKQFQPQEDCPESTSNNDMNEARLCRNRCETVPNSTEAETSPSFTSSYSYNEALLYETSSMSTFYSDENVSSASGFTPCCTPPSSTSQDVGYFRRTIARAAVPAIAPVTVIKSDQAVRPTERPSTEVAYYNYVGSVHHAESNSNVVFQRVSGDEETSTTSCGTPNSDIHVEGRPNAENQRVRFHESCKKEYYKTRNVKHWAVTPAALPKTSKNQYRRSHDDHGHSVVEDTAHSQGTSRMKLKKGFGTPGDDTNERNQNATKSRRRNYSNRTDKIKQLEATPAVMSDTNNDIRPRNRYRDEVTTKPSPCKMDIRETKACKSSKKTGDNSRNIRDLSDANSDEKRKQRDKKPTLDNKRGEGSITSSRPLPNPHDPRQKSTKKRKSSQVTKNAKPLKDSVVDKEDETLQRVPKPLDDPCVEARRTCQEQSDNNTSETDSKNKSRKRDAGKRKNKSPKDTKKKDKSRTRVRVHLQYPKHLFKINPKKDQLQYQPSTFGMMKRWIKLNVPTPIWKPVAVTCSALTIAVQFGVCVGFSVIGSAMGYNVSDYLTPRRPLKHLKYVRPKWKDTTHPGARARMEQVIIDMTMNSKARQKETSDDTIDPEDEEPQKVTTRKEHMLSHASTLTSTALPIDYVRLRKSKPEEKERIKEYCTARQMRQTRCTKKSFNKLTQLRRDHGLLDIQYPNDGADAASNQRNISYPAIHLEKSTRKKRKPKTAVDVIERLFPECSRPEADGIPSWYPENVKERVLARRAAEAERDDGLIKANIYSPREDYPGLVQLVRIIYVVYKLNLKN